MKQPTHSQKWYDRLCRIYSISDFPPLHSFSFTDWHWIDEDDLEKSRPCKIVPSISLSNDFWTMIMDDMNEPSRTSYSDVVRHSSSLANVIVPSKKVCHSTSVSLKKKHKDDNLYLEEDDMDNELWLQYKNMQRQTRRYQRRRTFKPPTQSCLENAHNDKDIHLEQRKRHVRKVTHQRKSPIRLVRHQYRHYAHHR